MARTTVIEERFADATLNLALDTVAKSKQALVFCNTKKGAESQAEKIAQKIKEPKNADILAALAERALKAVSSPTKQCKRLATCLKGGVAFHHAGLHSQQRELVETAFRDGTLFVICATPTLCLAPGTLLWSGTGDVPIERAGTSTLFALSGSTLLTQKPQSVETRFNKDALLEIVSAAGHAVRVTAGHRLLVKRDGKRRLVRADAVRRTDRIATVGRLKPLHTRYPYIGEFLVENPDVFAARHVVGVNLAYVVGVFLGDGYSGAARQGVAVVYKGTPCIVGRDEEVFSAVRETCKNLGVSFRRSINMSGVPQAVLGKNRWFREFLVRCGIEQGVHKHISENLLSLPDDATAALLRGLFDTDGCVELSSHRVSFSNTSNTLIRQTQRTLLRFGIVTYLRTKKPGMMRIADKQYATKTSFELHIAQKNSILAFAKHVGFHIRRKKNALQTLVERIQDNVCYVDCLTCNYRLYADMFSGRTRYQQCWGEQKRNIISLLGMRGELGSRELTRLLKHEPKKGDRRLNHHYALIKKRKIGTVSKTEWFWSLNDIGRWVWKNIVKKKNTLDTFFSRSSCPICEGSLSRTLKRGWRDQDADGDIFWDVIRSIRPSTKETHVYDVVLPANGRHDHLFVANGILVHNSMGMDLPAFRSIIRDLKRYSQGTSWGMSDIPVLEYEQMSGRAGRPGKETAGEAVCIAATKDEEERIIDHYIRGDPEDIYSKLAVEPVLRTYVLSLIASGYVQSMEALERFFGDTFYAFQYGDMSKIQSQLGRMVQMLAEWGFLDAPAVSKGDFVVASDVVNGTLRATKLGERVAQLYLDPLTAHELLTALERAAEKNLRPTPFALLHLVANTLELRPLFNVRQGEIDMLDKTLVAIENDLFVPSPSIYAAEYEEFLQTVKTATVLRDWIEEVGEDALLEGYNVTPGDLHAKRDRADWILHSLSELVKLRGMPALVNDLEKLRVRLEHGAKEELLALLRLKGVGRVRGRALYRNGIRTLDDLRNAEVSALRALVGNALAIDLKEQVGITVAPEDVRVKPNKRKGQIALGDYDGK